MRSRNPTFQGNDTSPGLSRFRARAVIDWVQLEIQTARTTNFHTVQDRLSVLLRPAHTPTVTALNAGAGGAATQFRITLHDPRDELLDAWDVFEAIMPLTDRTTVKAIEVAVDFYSRANDPAELEEMTMRLKKSIRAAGAVELQCGPGMTERLQDARRLRDGWTVVVRDGDIQWRIYLKTTDRKACLPPDEHRARVEVTLRGDRIPEPLTKLAQLRWFDLAKLTRLFAFREVLTTPAIDQPSTPAELALQRRQQLVDAKGHRELPVPKRRKHSPLTRADTKLKQRVRDALRELSRRLNAEKPGTNTSEVVETPEGGSAALITNSTN